MYAIEFESYLHHGPIKIPESHPDWIEKPVKVILLTTMPPTQTSVAVPKPRRLPKGAEQYHSGRSDISERAEEFLFPGPGVQSIALPCPKCDEMKTLLNFDMSR